MILFGCVRTIQFIVHKVTILIALERCLGTIQFVDQKLDGRIEMKLAIHGKLTMAQTSFAEFTHMISIGDAGCDLTEYRPQTIDPSAQLCMHFRDRSSRKRNDAPTEKDIWPLFEWHDSHQEIDGLLVPMWCEHEPLSSDSSARSLPPSN